MYSHLSRKPSRDGSIQYLSPQQIPQTKKPCQKNTLEQIKNMKKRGCDTPISILTQDSHMKEARSIIIDMSRIDGKSNYDQTISYQQLPHQPSNCSTQRNYLDQQNLLQQMIQLQSENLQLKQRLEQQDTQRLVMQQEFLTQIKLHYQTQPTQPIVINNTIMDKQDKEIRQPMHSPKMSQQTQTQASKHEISIQYSPLQQSPEPKRKDFQNVYAEKINQIVNPQQNNKENILKEKQNYLIPDNSQRRQSEQTFNQKQLTESSINKTQMSINSQSNNKQQQLHIESINYTPQSKITNQPQFTEYSMNNTQMSINNNFQSNNNNNNNNNNDSVHSQIKPSVKMEVDFGEQPKKMSLADCFQMRQQKKTQDRKVSVPIMEDRSEDNWIVNVKQRSKEEQMKLRKEMMQYGRSRRPTTQKTDQKDERTSLSIQRVSSPLHERLALGQKAKVEQKEMYALTRKNYENLPEVKTKKIEEERRQSKQNFTRERQNKLKELDEKIKLKLVTRQR